MKAGPLHKRVFVFVLSHERMQDGVEFIVRYIDYCMLRA